MVFLVTYVASKHFQLLKEVLKLAIKLKTNYLEGFVGAHELEMIKSAVVDAHNTLIKKNYFLTLFGSMASSNHFGFSYFF